MGGDEIVAEWLGDVYCKNITTTNAPQRLESSSKRFRSVTIKNQYDGSYQAWVGKYNSNTATFNANALYLRPLYEILRFEFVDLYELGCSAYITDHFASIRILGINEY